MTPKIKAKVGDVFRIPLAGTACVYGQVVSKAGAQHLVVVFQASPPHFAPAVLGSGIRLGGIIFDAKLRNGDWPIVASLAPVAVVEPMFTSGHELTPRGVMVERFDGTDCRRATPDEASRYGHRMISSPMVLQLAAEATEGLRPWNERFEHFRRLGVSLDPGRLTFTEAD
jgi:hypothetical protein